jgi:hypothetical protein
VNRGDQRYVGTALVVAGMAWAIAGSLMPAINAARNELELTSRIDARDLPPAIAISQVMFGSLRGLACDLLWTRAHSLEGQGRFHEAAQLARLISQLQPNYPRVWGFRAFNLAYNISVTANTGDERWMWVDQGLRLLRDEAIPLNPRSLHLRLELARIYLDKIGDERDDFHYRYKQALALEWQVLLGTPPRGDSAAVMAWLEPLARAPHTLDQLLAADPAVSLELEALARHGVVADRGLLADLEALAARSESQLLGWRPEEVGARAERLAHVAAWQQRNDGQASRRRLLEYIRAHEVRKRGLDFTRMIELVRRDGPLDFRHPATHGLYWADDGRRLLESRRELIEREEQQFWNVYRLLLAAGMQLTTRGEVLLDVATQRFRLLPNPRFVAFYERTVREAIDAVPDDRPGVKASFELGRRNFLLWAASVSHYYGDVGEALRLYAMLQRENPGDPHFAPSWPEKLDQLDMAGLFDRSMDANQARERIWGRIERGIQDGLAVGRVDVFERQKQQAERLRRAMITLAGAENLEPEDLQAIDEWVATAFARYMVSPVSGASILVRARVWRHAPLALRRIVHEQIQAQLEREARHAGLEPELAFPKPPLR